MGEVTRLGQNRIPLSVGTTYVTLPMLKINGAKIVKATHIAIYNSHATQTLTFYLGIRRGGKIHRYHYKATLAAAVIEPADTSLYFHQGDEFVIIAKASGGASTFEVCFQLLDVGRETSAQ